MKIVLVRHGQTPANRLGALDTVRPGLGLTPEGLLQAQRLADRWESEVAPPPTVIALSGLHRTRLTAAPLASAYGLTPQVHPGIRELRSGDLEMAADPASQSLYVRTTLSWCAGDLDNRMPGGATSDSHRSARRWAWRSPSGVSPRPGRTVSSAPRRFAGVCPCRTSTIFTAAPRKVVP